MTANGEKVLIIIEEMLSSVAIYISVESCEELALERLFRKCDEVVIHYQVQFPTFRNGPDHRGRTSRANDLICILIRKGVEQCELLSDSNEVVRVYPIVTALTLTLMLCLAAPTGSRASRLILLLILLLRLLLRWILGSIVGVREYGPEVW